MSMKTSYNERDSRLRVDWGDALAIPSFYGRKEEQTLLSQWVIQKDCRVVSVLGMGGIGKSALVVNVMHQLVGGTEQEPSSVPPAVCPFEVVIFRSLRDAPSCEALLDDCLQVFSPQPLSTLPAGQERGPVPTEQRLILLMEHLRKARTLIVLDNLECLLEEGNVRGHFRPGYEEYELLLHRVVETVHQSCLVFTSREKPAELRLLEGRYTSLRSLRLAGLEVAACQQFFVEKELVGGQQEQESLIEVYAGNPLALKIVAETIVALFRGEIGQFLASKSPVIFAGITHLLDEQFDRLSAQERTVLCWLAIMREPVTLDELLAVLVYPLPRRQVLLEAVDALRRRSLIESGKRAGSFTLQSVVLEYVTALLIEEGSREIQQDRLDRLIQYGLSQAHAKEYVRQTQERLLVSPLLADLQSVYLERIDGLRKMGDVGIVPCVDLAPTHETASEATAQEGDEGRQVVGAGSERGPIPTTSVEEQLLSLLDGLREQGDSAQGYGPANLIALLRLLRGDLKGLDLSHLCIRGVYLQGVEMQDASMAGAQIRDCVWTSAVNVAWTVAISLDGKWWASGGIQGQLRVWEGVRSPTLHLVWQAHTDLVYALAFSPDGRTLGSGSSDGTVKLWEVESGVLLWTGRQSVPLLSLAFSPDGRLLASGGMDATVRLWDPQSGKNLQTLTHPSHVWALAWSPDGSLLASGGKDGEIRLWEKQKGTALAFTPHLSVQTNWVSSLAFAPDGKTLASTSWGDQTVKLWEVSSHGASPRGQLLHTLPGYTDQSRCVAWSPDGRTLAYSNPDKGIWLWDVEEGRCRAVLHGHTTDVYGLAFTPDGTRLLSGSADSTLRVWDIADYRCVRVTAGYVVSLWDLDWSPDGTHLVSGGTNGQVTLWDIRGATPPRVLYSHTWIVEGVGWSPDGQYLSSCGMDGVLCLWDPTSHTLVHRFENSRVVLLGMAWSPNGNQLACGTYGRGIQVWDVTTRSLRFIGQTHPTAFWGVAWSPNGTQLVGGGNDGCVYLWECADGSGQVQDAVPLKLSGHQNRVMGVAWSPDGKWLASGSGNRSNGELFLWDIQSVGAVACPCPVQTFEGHPGMVYALAWSRCRDGACPHGDQLISGGSDGMLRWWDVESGTCIIIKEAHHGIIRALKVSPDGKLLASCGEDGAIMIWDLTSHEHLRTLRRDRPYERLNITGIRGLNEAEIASLQALGAIDEAAR
jgi:WD40 repeat protein